ncbi:methyl-accepting chemotaxis protein [Magnetospirillum sulfuroxidans]|uniref:methyl-accepting chemotaxis protein n=1 Tax=Magnetospirillum sulfuroxidans TaxID=611300 RepID=UPI0031FE71D1
MVAIVALVLSIVSDNLARQAVESQKVNLKVFQELLRAKGGGGPHLLDGKLAWGNYVVDDNHEVVDILRQVMGIGASIFKGDLRVSTNVLTTEGKRGVGTKLAQGAIYDTVLKNGQSFFGEANVIGTLYLVGYDAIKDDSGKVIGAMVAGMPRSTFFSMLEDIRLPVIGITAAIGAVTCLMIFLITRAQMAALPRLAQSMDRLAGKDYASDIPHLNRSDEIGAMARALNGFKTSLRHAEELDRTQTAEREARERTRLAMDSATRDFAATIEQVVKSVANSASDLRGNAQRLSSAADQTLGRSSAVADASNTASGNVQAVASATEELSASIGEISRQVAQATEVAVEAVNEAENTNATVRSLAASAARIGEVIKLINDIASQTNLLALNATIEAARAGEAGKGFAVVAAEVKGLANQTARATEDIQSQVEAIQQETTRAVRAIADIGQTINRISAITATVASAVTEQGAATSEIARSVGQASSGTNEVSHSIADVTAAARDTEQGASEILASATTLTGQSEALQREVDNFIQRIQAA